MTDTATIPQPQHLSAEMREHLRAASVWEVVHRPEGAGTFPARVLAARRAVKQLELDLGQTASTTSVPSNNAAALL